MFKIKEKGTILFQDESTFLMLSQKCYSWGEKRKPLEEKVHMTSEYSKVFSSIELTTGNCIIKEVKRVIK